MNFIKIILFCIIGTNTFSMEEDLQNKQKPSFRISEEDMRALVEEIDKPQISCTFFSTDIVGAINQSWKDSLSDIKEEINDIKKRNSSAHAILDFFEQYKVTATKNLTSLVVISHINSTETLLYNVYLASLTLGLRTIESVLQEEFNSHPTETQIALLSKPFALTPFEIRVIFTLIGLYSILQKSDSFAFTSFGLSCFFLLPIHQNHALSETCGLISDMILINAIYNLAQDQCMHCYSNDLQSPST